MKQASQKEANGGWTKVQAQQRTERKGSILGWRVLLVFFFGVPVWHCVYMVGGKWNGRVGFEFWFCRALFVKAFSSCTGRGASKCT